MAEVNINTNNNLKTQGQFTIEYQNNGYGGMVPVINGEKAPMLTFGYVTESDKEACIELITKAALATNGNIMEMCSYIMNAIQTAAADIKPDEAVDIDGVEMLISYEDKAIYLGTEKIADLEDIESDLGNEATKLLLIERARNVMAARQAEDDEYYDDDEEEYDW